jgi:exodeoxyribonuclease V alpha subunit
MNPSLVNPSLVNQVPKPDHISLTNQAKLASLVAAFRAKQDAAAGVTKIPSIEIASKLESPTSSVSSVTDKYGNSITYNDKQEEFIRVAVSGKSCILIGAAGTGKTTTQKGTAQALISSGMVKIVGSHSHKTFPSNVPGIAILAYTRRATNNIRRNMSEDLKDNCLTIHKFLQYEPVYYDTDEINPKTGDFKRTMRFEPTRNELNPIPASITTIVIEEASMVSVELFNQIVEACPHNPQYILLGDIQQLPPVFGSAILGFKMLEWHTVELTEVYRQALESPIIRLAHRILSGNPIPASEYPNWFTDGQLKIHPWQKKISADIACVTLAKFFVHALDKGMYNPETDGILIPFNKGCGTDELNKHIANKIAKDDGRIVYEVIHGFKKSYYSVGDKCLYDREDAIILDIYSNPEYAGTAPAVASKALNYWGHYEKAFIQEGEEVSLKESNQDMDFLLAQVSMSSTDEDRVHACSHCIKLQLLDTDREVTVNNAGQLNNLILGYAITVHKSQGSEWEKVFLCLHQSHATMLQRELLYTAVTRAKKDLFIICEEESFQKGITSQRIKGNTLAEKAEFFKGKLDSGDMQS